VLFELSSHFSVFGVTLLCLSATIVLFVLVCRFQRAYQEAAARAVKCSLLVHEAIKLHPPVNGVKLTLHAGMGCGKFAAVVLGGSYGNKINKSRWEFVIAGKPLAQIAVAEPVARPGETVLSPEVHRLVGGMVLAEEIARPTRELAGQALAGPSSARSGARATATAAGSGAAAAVAAAATAALAAAALADTPAVRAAVRAAVGYWRLEVTTRTNVSVGACFASLH
jgi:hypothetical protein